MDKPAKVILMRTTGTAVSLSADAAKLPRRIKVLNWGDNPNSHGKRVNVGPLFAKCLSAETYPYRKVALDFEHNTFPGTAAYKESKEPRPVAGFGTIEAVEGEGVFITMSSWTPDGERMAANYADVSAGAVTDEEGNLIAVASVALCRTGSVEGMDFVEAPLSGSVSSALSGIAHSREFLVAALAAAFDESKHPRAEDGKWTDGGGGGSTGSDRGESQKSQPSVADKFKAAAKKAAKDPAAQRFNDELKKARKAKDGAGIARAHMMALKAGMVWDKSIKGYRPPVAK
jgi:phage I-like protein